MTDSRLFVPQHVLDQWLSEAQVVMDRDTLVLRPEHTQYKVETALHFLRELTTTSDVSKLVGKVKSLAAIKSQGGEHCHDSVLLGDAAYEVEEGFLCTPVVLEVTPPEPLLLPSQPDSHAVADMHQELVHQSNPSPHRSASELDMLAKLFLGGRT